jgi:3-phosphoshikimate 1-carboxyvinyltransferase
MDSFAQILPHLGVILSDFEGHLPFTVYGPLRARSIKIDASVSSQFLSGLLFALSYCAEKEIVIETSALNSKPYVDMTLEMLKIAGKPIAHDNYEVFHINPILFSQKNELAFNIEGDWSNASYWLVAGAINGSVSLTGLNTGTSQADKVLLDVLRSANAAITIEEQLITVKSTELSAFEFDATHCPDLFPALAILATACDGESYISGVQRLFHKESNRAESICEMLQQFEVPFSIEDDTLCISGLKKLKSASIDSYNDHRIVMAASVAALHCNGPITITGAEAVNKSYPGFFSDLGFLGIEYSLKND